MTIEENEVAIHSLEKLEQTLSTGESDCDNEENAVSSPTGFAVSSPTGFAVSSPTGFAVSSPTGFAVS